MSVGVPVAEAWSGPAPDLRPASAIEAAARHAAPAARRAAGRAARERQATCVKVAIVGAAPGQKGFAVQPRRWVVERTFGRLARCRKLARDHEATPSSALAFLMLAAAMILVRRLAKHL